MKKEKENGENNVVVVVLAEGGGRLAEALIPLGNTVSRKMSKGRCFGDPLSRQYLAM